MGIHSPAIIIVGGVCALAEELCWFQRLPLYGKRILVTRPGDRAGTLSEKLRDLGADVVEFPCIRTEAVGLQGPPGGGTDNGQLHVPQSPGVLPHAPQAVPEGIHPGGAGEAQPLKGLLEAGMAPDTPAAMVERGTLPGQRRCGAPLASGTRSAVKPWASKARPVAAPITASFTFPRARASFVTFTSASTVKGFVSAVGGDADFSRFTGLCIGKQTAGEAEKHHISVKRQKHRPPPPARPSGRKSPPPPAAAGPGPPPLSPAPLPYGGRRRPPGRGRRSSHGPPRPARWRHRWRLKSEEYYGHLGRAVHRRKEGAE